MKTFMLVGDVSDNAGPSNVHRELIAHWPAEEGLLVPRWSNAVSKLMSVVAASMRCDVLLTTGARRLGAIAWAIARKRNVPVIVLVHGYLPYENEVNNLGLSDEIVREWRLMLHTADVVVTNSEFHADCLRAAEPDIAEKVRWFNLGIEPFVPRDHGSQGDVIRVAVSGGTRPIKGNESWHARCRFYGNRVIESSCLCSDALTLTTLSSKVPYECATDAWRVRYRNAHFSTPFRGSTFSP